MTKRLSSKLLSVILALAICATTVFGCLMTVSANTSWLSFSAGESTDVELTKASIELTVNLGDLEGFTTVENNTTIGGMMAGEVDLSYGDGLTLTGVKATSGTKVDAKYSFITDEFKGNGYVNFDSDGFGFLALNNDDVYYKSLTFVLDFELASPAKNGDKFIVTATSAEIAGGLFDITYEENNNVTGTIVMGCDHKLEPAGDLIITDTVNGYAVYNESVCSECNIPFGKQVVPTKLPGVINVLEYDQTKPEDNGRYYDPDLADNGETGEDWEHAIIIDSALELSYLARYAGNETKGKYYKVADGISGFDMSGGKINLDGTLEENFDAIINSSKRHDAGETYFQGHFDGNGATVYGLWTKYDEDDGTTPSAAGLFAYAKGDVEIKNINVSLSYLKAKYHAGGIVGAYSFDTAIGANDGNKLIIEKCSVTDCHIETTAEGTYGYAGTGGIVAGTGAIYGGARCYSGDWNGEVKVSNCFINLDEAHFVSLGETQLVNSVHGGIGGVAVSQKATFDNCVVIGIAPYSVYNTEYTPSGDSHQHTFLKGRFSNIYTTAAVTGVTSGGVSNSAKTQDYTGVMYQISANQIKGADAETNMPNLAWGSVWEIDVNRGYPKFKQAETPKLVNDTSDFELTLIGTNITYNNGGDYNYNFYYRPNKTEAGNNYKPDLYVAQLNEDNTTLGSFHRLTGEVLETSPVAGVEKGDIRYTIERLSAREIYNTLLATAVAVKDGKALWGETDDFSIAETEQKIIDGAEYETADKNLAEAVLKYGKASKAALNTKNDTAGKTIYWNGGKAAKFYGDDDGLTAADPIIINTAEEFAFVATGSQADTKDRYFKMADGISKVVLQNEDHGKKIVELDSADAVRKYFEDELGKKNSTFTRWVGNSWNATVACFSGNFDGNGVEFYGMYNTNGDANSYYGTVNSSGGLFYITDGATISNLAVKNSYTKITGTGSHTWQFGLIVSYGKDPTNDENNGTNNIVSYLDTCIDRCTVANNYIYKQVSDSSLHYVGTVCGNSSEGAFVMTNCLLYGNSAKGYRTTAQDVYDLPVIGGNSYNVSSIKNSIILDNALLATYEDGTLYKNWSTLDCFSKANSFKNVYTNWDLDSITDLSVDTNNAFEVEYFRANGGYEITESQAMGVAAMTNMPNLDWTGTWCYGDTYPSLAKGTYSSSSAGKTIYWDNREIATSLDSFEKDGDVYIINKVSELAYISSALPEVTTGKKFRVADGIDKIVLQSKTYGDDIIALDSADTVKDYFAANSSKLYQWVSNTYYDSGRMCFAGSFDGNGAEIYGMLSTGRAAGGLFGIVDSATISNLALKNSYTYLTGKDSSNDMSNWQFGLLVSYGVNADTTNDDVIYFNNCTLANNYIYKHVNQTSYNNGWTGLVLGASTVGPCIMQNMLIYGNSFTAYADHLSIEFYPGLIGAANRPKASADYIAAHPRWVSGDAEPYMTTVLENSVVLGTPIKATSLDGTTLVHNQWLVLSVTGSYNDCFENVYTDWNVNNITDNDNFKKAEFLKRGGHTVSENDLIGNTAKATEIVGIFNADNAANNNDTVWYTGNGARLSLNPPTEMLPSAQAVYDAITFKTADDYGNNDNTFGVCATSLNLKTNPYISFAFAFSGKYKSNRDKIKVTFTYTVSDDPSTTADNDVDTDLTKDGIQINKTVDVANESGALLDGWSNPSNDRYHTYRFENIPVVALGSPITVTVAYNGEEKVTTGTFSVEGFGLERVNDYKQTPCKYYETRIEVVKALLFYTQMLQARYGA